MEIEIDVILILNIMSNSPVGSGDENKDDEELSISASGSQSETEMSATSMKSEASVGKNELENWVGYNIKQWLLNLDMISYWKVFSDEGWITGEELLKLTYNDITNAAITKFANNKKYNEKQIKADAKKIMREISKLKENEYDDANASNLTGDDILEFERRLTDFMKKWQRIEWIDEYVEDWDGRYIKNI